MNEKFVMAFLRHVGYNISKKSLKCKSPRSQNTLDAQGLLRDISKHGMNMGVTKFMEDKDIREFVIKNRTLLKEVFGDYLRSSGYSSPTHVEILLMLNHMEKYSAKRKGDMQKFCKQCANDFLDCGMASLVETIWEACEQEIAGFVCNHW